MKIAIAILMGTFNGQKYLEEQLDSIERQSYKDWRLIVSDDGSTDRTIQILEEYKAKWPDGRLEIRAGPRKGFCNNFMSMALAPEIKADYYAFADQDDVWLPEKLQVAADVIRSLETESVPTLFCSRTTYVKDNLVPYGQSPLFVYPKTFRNALVQSIAGGNTMVFNKAAKRLVERAQVSNAVSHDWWLYQLVSGAGGIVYYDQRSTILYRQHDGALVGGKTSLGGQLKRFQLLLQGRFKEWNDINIQALYDARASLNHSSLDVLDLFVRLRKSDSLIQRLRMLEVCGLYRQTWRETATLILAAALKKL